MTTPTASAPILRPPAHGSWNQLLGELVTVVDARPLGARATDPDLGVAARMAVTAASTSRALEVGLAPYSESNLYEGFDGIEGVFVATWDEPANGEVLDVAIHLPGGERVDVLGCVEWSRASGAYGGPGVGLRFIGLDESDARRLARFARHRPPIFHA